MYNKSMIHLVLEKSAEAVRFKSNCQLEFQVKTGCKNIVMSTIHNFKK